MNSTGQSIIKTRRSWSILEMIIVGLTCALGGGVIYLWAMFISAGTKAKAEKEKASYVQGSQQEFPNIQQTSSTWRGVVKEVVKLDRFHMEIAVVLPDEAKEDRPTTRCLVHLGNKSVVVGQTINFSWLSENGSGIRHTNFYVMCDPGVGAK